MNDGVIIICVIGAFVFTILTVEFIVLSYEDAKGYVKAELDLYNIKTCSEVILFNSDINSYSLSSDGYKNIKNTIKQKLELLKCP